MIKITGKEDVVNYFTKIDNNLEQDVEIIIIGATSLILNGMEFRQTADIDVWTELNSSSVNALRRASIKAGLDFDPNDYSNPEKPYIQLVQRDFVHMPKSDEWEQDSPIVWAGNKLKVRTAPHGVILCSKMAAARERDLDDATWLSGFTGDWEKEVNKYINLFNQEDINSINENKIIIELQSSFSSKSIKTPKP